MSLAGQLQPHAAGDARKPAHQPNRFLRAFLRNRISVVGAVVVLVILVCAALAPVLAPHDPRDQSILRRLEPPSAQNLLGTDRFGRDILSRLLYGARVSIAVGLVATGIGGLIGTVVGVFSGFRGGRTDRVIMGIVDVILSFPDLLLGILVLIFLGPGLGSVIAAISISMIPRFIRVARGPTLTLRSIPFVEACEALGMRELRILLRHILPNILGQVFVVSTLWIASAIRVEASLSFLGLGVQPPTATWGNMIRDGIRDVFSAPWIAVAPSMAIMITVLAFNMFGDGLRDLFDPKTSRS